MALAAAPGLPCRKPAGPGRLARSGWLLLLLCLCRCLYAADTVQVHIEGIQDPLLSNVRNYLSLEQQKEHPRLTAERIRRLHRRAPEEIEQALQPFGYYRPRIDAELEPPSAGDTVWQAYYRIDKGPPLPVKTVAVRLEGPGKENPDFQTLLAHFPVKVGDTLNHSRYEQGKQTLQDLARDQGYLEAAFSKSQILIDEQVYQADITLDFITGPRYRFGTVTFRQDTFDEELLDRFVTFHPGDFYTLKALADFRYGLTASGYFDEITVDTQPDRQAKKLNIVAILTPKKVNQYRARIGYGTDSGFRAGVDWERRYLNRYGHRLDAALVAKQDKRRLEATTNYLIPLGRPEEDYLNLSLKYEGKDLDIRDFDIPAANENQTVKGSTRSNQVSLQIATHHPRNIFDAVPLKETLGLEYFVERYNLWTIFPQDTQAQIRQDNPDAIPAIDANYRLLTPNINWLYEQADNRLYITRGQQLRLGLRGSKDGWGSNVWFWQGRLDGAMIRRMGPQGRLILRGDIGHSRNEVVQVGKLEANEVPESILFKTGGETSVRGYAYETLNYRGLGARDLLVGSIEYEYRIYSDWGLAAFYDAGNVANGFSNLSLARGAGAGLRWYSPIGPVRLDLASALSKEGNPWRIQFNVGPEF